MALTDERQCLVTVQVHRALGEDIPRVVAWLLDIDVDPSYGVGHALEAFEADETDVVDTHTYQGLQRLDKQRRAAVGVRRVILSMPWPGIET